MNILGTIVWMLIDVYFIYDHSVKLGKESTKLEKSYHIVFLIIWMGLFAHTSFRLGGLIG